MTLPDGLKFLHIGWWLLHAVTIMLIWSWAYRKGRDDERKARRAQGTRPGEAPPVDPRS